MKKKGGGRKRGPGAASEVFQNTTHTTYNKLGRENPLLRPERNHKDEEIWDRHWRRADTQMEYSARSGKKPADRGSEERMGRGSTLRGEGRQGGLTFRKGPYKKMG